jgi:hypothetical protein
MLEMNILGVDGHSATFTMAVLDEQGQLVDCSRHATSEENLIQATCAVPQPRWLVVEESHLAQWIKMTLKPHVDKLTVCDPKHNRWIAQDDFANDRTSAIKLAELAGLDKLREVYHPGEYMGELRSLFLHYYDLTLLRPDPPGDAVQEQTWRGLPASGRVCVGSWAL